MLFSSCESAHIFGKIFAVVLYLLILYLYRKLVLVYKALKDESTYDESHDDFRSRIMKILTSIW